jgi:hypothetical protein
MLATSVREGPHRLGAWSRWLGERQYALLPDFDLFGDGPGELALGPFTVTV